MKRTVLQTLGMDVLAGTGSPIRVLEISRNLSKKGHRVFLTSFCQGEDDQREVDGISIRRIPFSNVMTEEARALSEVPRLMSLNKNVAIENGVDIIHSHLFTAANSAYLIKKRTGMPYVYDMHSLFPDERLSEGPGVLGRARLIPMRQIEKKLRKNADYIVATSDTMKDYLVKEGYGKVESVPVGVDTDFFRPMEKNQEILKKYGLEGKKVVAYTGNTNPYQGFGDIIESVPHAVREDRKIVFMIVGDGSDMDKYKKRVRDIGMENNVVFTGRQPYETMPDFLSVADLCLSMRTSTFAGNMTFPTKLTTYMAAGKPSVCTSTGDQKTMCERHSIGCVVGSGDPKALGKAIADSLGDPALLEKQGRVAREAAVREYSWDVLCERYEKIYDSIFNDQ